jgi:large subunit ribosomal protein L29
MNVDKIRNLTDIELTHQQRELSDQLFKMKFQLKMGQTESLKKIRELKKDIARVNTVIREKELADGNGAARKPAVKAAATTAPKTPRAVQPAAPKKVTAKKTTKAAKKATAAAEKK